MNKQDKIKVDYKKLKEALKDPVIRKKIDETYSIETRYAIIMAINNFGSANIKKLAKLLGKNDATIYHHIREMKKPPSLLEIDVEMTNSHKGIYYCLSPLASRHFGEPSKEDVEDKMMAAIDKLLEQSDKEISRIYMEMLANHPDLGQQCEKEKRSFAYNRILENIMLNNLDNAEKAFMRGAKPKNPNYPLGSLANFPLVMKISKPRHTFEILKLLTNFQVEFNKLKEKIEKEMNSEKIPEAERINMHYHIVGGEIAEFEFE
ncbi:hypothetical protein ES705_42510 [subsurface metagenome]